MPGTPKIYDTPNVLKHCIAHAKKTEGETTSFFTKKANYFTVMFY